MRIVARTLSRILGHDEQCEAVRKAELRRGDRVVVETENSVYTIRVGDDASYQVAGGWFDRNGGGPARTAINGCTWGGSIIQTRVVAARGLRLEFANRVVTSPIRKFWVVRADSRRTIAENDAALLATFGIRWEEGSDLAEEIEPRKAS
jgi:hypothetical protein